MDAKNTICPFADIGNFTTFPNAVLDYVMPECRPNTWKVVCATIRNTIGWYKDEDVISLSQYQRITGIKSRGTLVAAINDALDMGYITRVRRASFEYALNEKYEIRTNKKYENRTFENDEISEKSENRTNKSPKIEHTKEIGKKSKDKDLKKAAAGVFSQQQKKEKFNACKAALCKIGIRGEKMLRELASLKHITPEYILAHAALAKRQNNNVGLLIHRIRSGDAMPKNGGHRKGCQCEKCRHKYIEGEFADFINH